MRTTRPTEMFSLRVIFKVSISSAFSSTAASPFWATRSASVGGEGHELVRLGHEVGLRPQLDDRGHAVGMPDGHRALGGVAVGPLGLAGQPLLTEELGRPVEVAVRSPRGRSWRPACRRRSSGGASGRPWRKSRARSGLLGRSVRFGGAGLRGRRGRRCAGGPRRPEWPGSSGAGLGGGRGLGRGRGGRRRFSGGRHRCRGGRSRGRGCASRLGGSRRGGRGRRRWRRRDGGARGQVPAGPGRRPERAVPAAAGR